MNSTAGSMAGIVYTSGQKAELASTGIVTIHFDETLVQNVTMYRELTGSYQEKSAKLIVRQRVKAGNFDECFRCVGSIPLQLNKYGNQNVSTLLKLKTEGKLLLIYT